MSKSIISKLQLSKRLDIFVRVLYIEAYFSKVDFEVYRKIYKKNVLLATGGVEGEKNNVETYEKDFCSLINVIKKEGYDNKYPITLSEKFELIDGGHRLACCIYFGIEPSFSIKKGEGGVQDFKRYKENGFEFHELLKILDAYTRYNENYFIYVIRPTLKEKSEEIKRDISKKGTIIGNYNYTLSSYMIEEFIHDLYCHDYENFKNTQYNLKKKISLLSMYKDKTIEVCLFEKKEEFDERVFKEFLRNKYKKYIQFNEGDEKFYTFHAGDSNKENGYLRNLLLNFDNIESYKLRSSLGNKSSFLERLSQLDSYAKKYSLNKSDFCIVGSSILELYGLKTARDLDVLTKGNEIIEFNDNDPIKVYTNQKYMKSISNIAIIEKCTITIRGFRIISLEKYYEYKQSSGKKKDIVDILKIEKFLAKSKKKKSLLASIKFYSRLWKKIFIVYFFLVLVYITKKIKIYKFLSRIWIKYFLRKD